MAATTHILKEYQGMPVAITAAIGGLSLPLFLSRRRCIFARRTGFSKLPHVPRAAGDREFAATGGEEALQDVNQMGQDSGPNYSLRTGASTLVVLNTTEVAKEAMVTRYSSISTRKLSNALTMLTFDKCMVATSDYNDFRKMVKRYVLTNVLGANAQGPGKGHGTSICGGRAWRELTCRREEIFKVLVIDITYLKWVPNRSVENKIRRMIFRRKAVMKALIKEQKRRIASGDQV